MAKKPTTVAEYLASVPAKHRAMLTELRNTIRKAAPQATERISYGMPYYDYQGRLAYFRLASNHIGLYIPTPTIDQLKKELGALAATKATVHLPLDKKLPITLIHKLITTRVQWMDKIKADKKSKICNRGHVFQGTGPCLICLPGRLKKK